MPVSAIDGVSSMYTQSSGQVREPSKGLADSGVMMQLFITQLRNQDPSAPMDTNQMLQQMSAMTGVELQTAMKELMQENYVLGMRTNAQDLVGKQVTYIGEDGETAVTGVVTSVSFETTMPTLKVGDESVYLSGVTSIAPAPAVSPTA